MADRLEVSTEVYVPPSEAYDFLVDFPGYAEYSEHITNVEQYGDGTPPTEYDLTVSWWLLSYTSRSRVTNVESPERIDWEIVKDVDANGHWLVEEIEPPAEHDEATEVRLVMEVEPDSADASVLDLPRLVSFSWIVSTLRPIVLSEAEEVVERIVTDLEGEPREVDLEIHETPL